MKQINPEEVSLRTLTGGEKAGSGVFDELMRAIRNHLIDEHTAGRITGDSFARTYAALISEALANANQFALSYQTTNQRNKLIDHEIEQAKANTDLIKAQITKMVAETMLIEEQRQIAILNQDLIKVQTSNETKRGIILDKQSLELDKNIALKEVQTNQVTEQTKLIIQQTANALTENTTMIKQQAKLDSEKNILDQKLVTETAQTSDTVGGHAVGGVVGKQITLYERQADGYLRDAEQKAAKFYTDMMATRVSTSEDTYDLSTAKMQNEQVAQVLDKVRQGIGMSPAV